MSLKLELKKFEIDPYDTGKQYVFWNTESYDVTDYLIEDTLKGDFRVEFTQPFDMGTSGLSFELTKDASVSGLLGLSLTTESFIGVQLWQDDVPEFLGALDTKSSYFSETEQKYILNFVDLFKLIYDAHSGYDAEDIISADTQFSKLEFLTAYNSTFITSHQGTKAVLSIGNEYPHISLSRYQNNSKDMYVNDFLIELVKHHSAFMYMNGYGRLVFCDRTFGLANSPPRDITVEFLEDGLDKPFAFYPIYNSVLLNVFGAWELNSMGNYEQWEGWALIYYENGQYKEFLGVDAELSNIPLKFRDKYIDLRQYLGHSPDYSFAYNNIFGAKTRAETLSSFKQIINPSPSIKGVYKGIDLSLLERVVVNSNWNLTGGRDVYIIYNMEKDYTNNVSTLELIRA